MDSYPGIREMALLKSSVSGSEFGFSMTLADFEQVNTPPLLVDQVSWRFLFIRKDNAFNVCLYCDYANTSDEWWIEAEGRLKITSSKEGVRHVEAKFKLEKFMDASRMSQIVNCIKYEDLAAPQNGFIQNGRIAIECAIFSKPLVKEPCQLSNVTNCMTRQFTVRIENVSKLVTVYSKKFNLRGINWFAKFQKSKDNLEIYLSKDETEQDFTLTVDVIFKVKLLSFNQQIHPIEKHLRRSYPIDRAFGFGWPNFVSWDTFMEDDKQYVQNDTAFFVVSIEVGRVKPIMLQRTLGFKEKVLVHACPICFKQFDSEGAADVVATSCGHLFCAPCITTSIKGSPHCPLCNTLVLVNDFRKIYF